MVINKTKRIISIFIVVHLLFLFSGCAYFNAFYNAERYFQEAENARLLKAGESLPSSAKTAYQNVIDKSIHVIKKYPQSKYVYPAMLLIGKSRFYLEEFTQAESMFRQLKQEGGEDYGSESQFWLALTKWKSGKIQSALDELHSLNKKNSDNQLKAKIFLSLAEIYLELELSDKSLFSLEKAAELTKNRSEKDQIYYQLSTLSFKNKDYDRALSSYKNVIKYTLVKSRREEANLQLVRIYRLRKNFNEASNTVKDLLADDEFASVHGELELELAKISIDQFQNDAAKTRLESISTDYKNTEVSAESFFLLGEIQLKKREFDKALQSFEQVSTENRKSAFISLSKLRIKEIQAYQNANQELANLLNKNIDNLTLPDTVIVPNSISFDSKERSNVKTKESPIEREEMFTSNSIDVDTTQVDSQIQVTKNNQIAEKLYLLGELEAFHFNNPDTAISRIQTIVDQYSGTEIYPKALFTLNYLSLEKGESVKSAVYEDILLNNFSDSEFAEAIRKRNNLQEDQSDNQLEKAENLWELDEEASMNVYKTILLSDSTSELSARAVYSLAYFYDLIYIIIDFD